jgi:two-component system, NtrC family, sensor histidine kinase HydH
MKLLAPTVLVSLALVAACIFGLFYLNDLHVEASDVLSENEKSTRAAMQLETSTRALIHLLREHTGSDFSAKVTEQFQQVEACLNEAQLLANWEPEKELVKRIARGLESFEQERNRLIASEGKLLSSDDRQRLAGILQEQVLAPSTDLQKYNSIQIEESDHRNRRIIRTLQWGLVILGIGVPLSGLVLGFAMARSLRHSIYQLSVGIQDAAGKLNRTLGSVTLEEESELPDLHRRVQGIVAEIERVVDQLQQREREVLRAEQLAAVGQVAAGVAHELRNPLTSVKMLVQTGLEGNAPSGLAPEDLTVMENEIRRMEQCIQVFLDFARPPTPERRETDLTSVLRRALALVEGRARRQKVDIHVKIADGPLTVRIDPEQIHQVFVNLLLNALEALPQGGNIEIAIRMDSKMRSDGAAGEVNGSAPAAFQRVSVQIRDNGPGIEPRVRKRLFEPFVSSKETGLGLGLSICKRLIEDHGGVIRGDNRPEGGAEFAFTLPR